MAAKAGEALMRCGIRLQLLLPLAPIALGLIAVSALNAWSAGQRARDEIVAQEREIATTVNAVTIPLNAQTLRLMRGLSGAEFVLCDEQRRPIRGPEGERIATIENVPERLPVPSDDPAVRFGTTIVAGGGAYFGASIALHHSARPGAVLYVLSPESRYREAVWQALRPAIWVGVIGTGVSALLGGVLVHQIGRRISNLERRTRLIAEGDFSPMPLPSLNDELRDLTHSVNDMAERLSRYQEQTRQTERLRLLGQVSGGLAHQLRNAAAGARLAVQLFVEDLAADANREALDVALRQLALVEMHVKKFLDLGKALELHRQPCRLEEVIAEAVALIRPQCAHGGIELREADDDSPSIRLNADAGQLTQLFLNLLVNAVEAAGPGGWIAVRWKKSGDGGAVIEITDSGPGPSEDVAARLFEPFVTGKPEGVGLGLAVARQIAAAHGGTVEWSRVDGTTCFRVVLPGNMDTRIPEVRRTSPAGL